MYNSVSINKIISAFLLKENKNEGKFTQDFLADPDF